MERKKRDRAKSICLLRPKFGCLAMWGRIHICILGYCRMRNRRAIVHTTSTVYLSILGGMEGPLLCGSSWGFPVERGFSGLYSGSKKLWLWFRTIRNLTGGYGSHVTGNIWDIWQTKSREFLRNAWWEVRSVCRVSVDRDRAKEKTSVMTTLVFQEM